MPRTAALGSSQARFDNAVITDSRGLSLCFASCAADAVRMQNIPQGHDAFQLVHIGAVHHGQNFNLVRPHAL